MSDTVLGATERVARYVVETSAAPSAVTDLVRRALIDTIGVTVAGAPEEAFQRLHRATADQLAPGRSTVFATGERTGPAQAALLNGTAGHALDYDDVNDDIYGHPSVALLPGILAVAESTGASGRDIVDAYSIGFDVAVAIAAALPVGPHFDRGWHATASVGVMSATAALCRLLHLSVEQTRHALGIAGSAVGSSRQNFGTMTKPLHPGLSSWNAVLACRLAANGFTADPEQLERKLGYFAVYGVDSDLDQLSASLDAPYALPRGGLNVKKYPCCYNTHRTADAAIALSRAVRGRWHEISAIRLTLQPTGLEPLIHHRPTTGLQGKFSGEYVAAAALLDGDVNLRSFTDAAVRRPEAQRLIRLVELAESPVPPVGPPEWDFAYVVVDVDLGQETLRQRVDVPRGDARLPLRDAELDAKFASCVEFAGVGWDAAGLLEEIKNLPAARAFDGFKHMQLIT